MVSINGDIDSELSLALDGVLGRVLTIVMVLKVHVNLFLPGSSDINLDWSSTNGHRLISPVASQKNKGIRFNAGIGSPGARQYVHVEGRALDRGSIQCYSDVVNSGIFRLVGNVVGTVTIVLNVGLDRSVRSLNVDIEFVTSFLTLVSVLVTGFNGKVGRVSVQVSGFQTGTLGNATGSVCSSFNGNVGRGVLDVVVVQWGGWVA